MALWTKKWVLWRFILCSLLVVGAFSVCIQGVTAEEQDGPSESQCRPYIEKALKDLEAGDSHSGSQEEKDDSGEAASAASSEDTNEQTDDDDGSIEASDDASAADGGSSEEGEDAPSLEVADEPYVDEVVVESDDAEAPKPEDSGEDNSQEEGDEQTEQSSAEDADSKEDAQDDGDSNEASAEDENAEDDKKDESVEGGADESDENKSGEVEGADDDSQEAQDGQESAEEAAVDDSKEDDASSKEENASQEETDEAEDASKEQADEGADDSKEQEDDSKEKVDESGEQSDDSKEDGDSKEQDDDDSKEQTDDSKEETDDSKEEVDQEEKDDSKEDSKESDDSKEQADDSKEQTDDSKEETDESVEGEQTDDSKETEESKEGTDDDSKEDDSKEGDAEKDSEVESEEKGESKEESDDSKEKTESAEGDSKEEVEEAEQEKSEVQSDEAEAPSDEEASEGDESQEGEEEAGDETPEDDLLMEIEIPENLRQREHVDQLLRLDEESTEAEMLMEKSADVVLRELKKLYDNAIKPLEILYKYRDLSNRHYGDPEIFSKPLVLFMGPWSGGKSSLINYLTDNEFTEWSLRTGAEPSPAYFNILMHGKEPQVLDGTQLAADWTFSGLQKFGQGLEERLRGLKLPNKLLERVNIVEIPGILEVRKQVSRVFPFNDACQWFIDRADIIFLVYDPSKLDVGPETEAILDQLKGRESQTRIILNKADQVKPEELMRVQSALIWNISPLMSSAQPPVMYTTSLWSIPYEVGSPARLLQSQERAFLKDLREAMDKRIENKISSARRFAVRVRNHAKMVDCYLTTYYNHKTIFGNKKVVAEAIIEHPQNYHIYEGLSTLTNISRYDLPDPETYRDFFRLNPLYEFQQLSATCTYFRGCPINRLDVAIAYDLPELVGKYKKMVETATPQGMPKS